MDRQNLSRRVTVNERLSAHSRSNHAQYPAGALRHYHVPAMMSEVQLSRILNKKMTKKGGRFAPLNIFLDDINVDNWLI